MDALPPVSYGEIDQAIVWEVQSGWDTFGGSPNISFQGPITGTLSMSPVSPESPQKGLVRINILQHVKYFPDIKDFPVIGGIGLDLNDPYVSAVIQHINQSLTQIYPIGIVGDQDGRPQQAGQSVSKELSDASTCTVSVIQIGKFLVHVTTGHCINGFIDQVGDYSPGYLRADFFGPVLLHVPENVMPTSYVYANEVVQRGDEYPPIFPYQDFIVLRWSITEDLVGRSDHPILEPFSYDKLAEILGSQQLFYAKGFPVYADNIDQEGKLIPALMPLVPQSIAVASGLGFWVDFNTLSPVDQTIKGMSGGMVEYLDEDGTAKVLGLTSAIDADSEGNSIIKVFVPALPADQDALERFLRQSVINLDAPAADGQNILGALVTPRVYSVEPPSQESTGADVDMAEIEPDNTTNPNIEQSEADDPIKIKPLSLYTKKGPTYKQLGAKKSPNNLVINPGRPKEFNRFL